MKDLSEEDYRKLTEERGEIESKKIKRVPARPMQLLEEGKVIKLEFKPLNKFMKAMYDQTVVKCTQPRCGRKFMFKNREKHYKDYCLEFQYYICKAPICKISEQGCECPDCKAHDCYNLALEQKRFDIEQHWATAVDDYVSCFHWFALRCCRLVGGAICDTKTWLIHSLACGADVRIRRRGRWRLKKYKN